MCHKEKHIETCCSSLETGLYRFASHIPPYVSYGCDHKDNRTRPTRQWPQVKGPRKDHLLNSSMQWCWICSQLFNHHWVRKDGQFIQTPSTCFDVYTCGWRYWWLPLKPLIILVQNIWRTNICLPMKQFRKVSTTTRYSGAGDPCDFMKFHETLYP